MVKRVHMNESEYENGVKDRGVRGKYLTWYIYSMERWRSGGGRLMESSTSDITGGESNVCDRDDDTE